MSVFFTLTRNTFRECLREPVFFLILASTLLLILSFPLFTFFAFHRQLWTILESSMAATLFLGFAAAVICSNACIQREMKNGTLLLLLSKPVSRFTFLLAKVTGIAGGMIVFSLISCTACMLITLAVINPYSFDTPLLLSFLGTLAACCLFGAGRNYFSGASFTENSIFAMLLGIPLCYVIFYNMFLGQINELPPEQASTVTFVPFLDILPVMVLLLLAILLMGAISTALALRLSFLGNMICCLILFLAGLVVSPWLKGNWGDGFFTGLINALIPNWQHFWMSYPLSHETTIPASYVGMMAIYAVVYGAIWILWAGVSFQCTELAKDSRS